MTISNIKFSCLIISNAWIMRKHIYLFWDPEFLRIASNSANRDDIWEKVTLTLQV